MLVVYDTELDPWIACYTTNCSKHLTGINSKNSQLNIIIHLKLKFTGDNSLPTLQPVSDNLL